MSHILINSISHIIHPFPTLLTQFSHITHPIPTWLILFPCGCPYLYSDLSDPSDTPFYPSDAPFPPWLHIWLYLWLRFITWHYHMTWSHDMSHDWLHNLSTWFDYIIDHMICHMIYHLTCHLIHHLTCHLTFIFSPQRSWVGWGCCWEDQGVVEEKVGAGWHIGVLVWSRMCTDNPSCS